MINDNSVPSDIPNNKECKNAPWFVWLQTMGVDDDNPSWPPSAGVDDVTWCVEQIFNSDTLYVRADLLRKFSLPGSQVVPLNPTPKMVWAAKEVLGDMVGWDCFIRAYKAMLAAAPEVNSGKTD